MQSWWHLVLNCPRCSKEISDEGNNYCPYCGVELKPSRETEDNIEEWVRYWVKTNSSYFKEGDYRHNIFKRCEMYRKAPDRYLQSMLETIPELVKWYFNVFQTVFIAAMAGLETTLFVLFVNNLTHANVLHWVVPLALFIVIFLLAIIPDKKTES